MVDTRASGETLRFDTRAEQRSAGSNMDGIFGIFAQIRSCGFTSFDKREFKRERNGESTVMMNWQTASIPIVQAFEPPNQMPDPLREIAGSTDRMDKDAKIRIIVIDDEALIAETVVEILKQEGFEATAVSTGLSAIELAKNWSPDIVLSDVIMPGLNGIETGIRIREIAPACRVILFSGQAATVDLLEDARHDGHRFDILAKPIKPERLVSIIRSAFHS